VARMKMGHRADLDELAQIAGALYSQTVVSFWRTVRKHDTWLKPSSLMRWHSDSRLHARMSDYQGPYGEVKSKEEWRRCC
jgi:putative transposase